MLKTTRPLFLGSGSPRRKAMLEELGLVIECRAMAIDETPLPAEEALPYVRRVTAGKMKAARDSLGDRGSEFSAIVVADTSVIVEGRILGKPRDESESMEMIGALVGKTHEVVSCYHLFASDSQELRQRTVSTRVALREAAESELRAYVASGEGLDKAGAYGIQGKASVFVRAIEGSYSNVVGLPLCELVEDMRDMGLLVAPS